MHNLNVGNLLCYVFGGEAAVALQGGFFCA